MREVSADDLYTVRWAINNGHEELALGKIAEMLGETVPPGFDTATRSRPVRLKVALVVGHNERKQGAVANGAMQGITEYRFNTEVAREIATRAPANLEIRRFNRVFTGSYSREIEEVYREVAAWCPDFAVEMHFNGGGGDYSVQLAAEPGAASQAAARRFSDVFASGLGVKNNGVHISRAEDRGGASLYAIPAPTILTEPFFGDNPEHTDRVAKLGARGMADLYLQAITRCLDLF